MYLKFISLFSNIYCDLLAFEEGEDVGVSSIGDAKNSDSVVSSAGWAEVDIISNVMVDVSIGKKGVVVDFSLDNGGGVGGDEDGLQISLSEGFQGGAVAEDGFTTFHDKG